MADSCCLHVSILCKLDVHQFFGFFMFLFVKLRLMFGETHTRAVCGYKSPLNESSVPIFFKIDIVWERFLVNINQRKFMMTKGCLFPNTSSNLLKCLFPMAKVRSKTGILFFAQWIPTVLLWQAGKVPRQLPAPASSCLGKSMKADFKQHAALSGGRALLTLSLVCLLFGFVSLYD